VTVIEQSHKIDVVGARKVSNDYPDPAFASFQQQVEMFVLGTPMAAAMRSSRYLR
jgi:hypothetical protein